MIYTKKHRVSSFNTQNRPLCLGTAFMGTAVGGIDYNTGALYGGVSDQCGGLMPTLTLGFGEAIKAFFGALDDALVYIWE